MFSMGVGAVTVTGSLRVGCINVICLACRLILPSGLERRAPYFKSPFMGHPIEESWQRI